MSKNEALIIAAIDTAEEIYEPQSLAQGCKPRLLVDKANPDITVAEVRDILSKSPGLYDRGVPVRLAYDLTQKGHVAQVMTPDGLVRYIHNFSRPYQIKTCTDGSTKMVDCGFPRNLAVMYLDWRGEWQLPAFNGIAAAPILASDGTIASKEGYDPASGMWCENMPDVSGFVPEQPSIEDARQALFVVRETFKTFCFADAETIPDPSYSLPVIDTAKPPGKDESAFLIALLTAVCRPSLHLAPGILLRAAAMSGAGAGKGLLARCTCLIAFGREPHAVTSGAKPEELEKRIAAELMEGSPALFLDNLNNTAFRSDLLASAITERPAKVRVLGKSLMVLLNPSALIILTGNGLTISEDLARRFIAIDLDPRTEDPEARAFPNDIKADVKNRRLELLAALLTIWRWGRQSSDLTPGKPLGSFEQWGSWVRDPLLALGCQDPAERISEAKERDGRRELIAELFAAWWAHHGDHPTPISKLHDDVKAIADPQGRGRQYLSTYFGRLAGTRVAGFVLTRQASGGKWGAATYTLIPTDDGHRTHRGHRDGPRNLNEETVQGDPMPPMHPMPRGDAEDWARDDDGWSAEL